MWDLLFLEGLKSQQIKSSGANKGDILSCVDIKGRDRHNGTTALHQGEQWIEAVGEQMGKFEKVLRIIHVKRCQCLF